MGWLTNLLKRSLTEAMVEVLEPRIRTIVRDELDVREPRIRTIVRDELDVREPRIRTIVRDELDVREPRIRTIVRDELRIALEQEWLPRLQTMWREDLRQVHERLDIRFDSVQGRLDTLSDLVVRYSELRMKEWMELAGEVRSLRSDVDRIKAHIGMTGGDER